VKKKKTVTVLPLDAPGGYSEAQLAAITAEDDYNRLMECERLVTLLSAHCDRRIASIAIPSGIVDVTTNGSKWACDDPDPPWLLIERLRQWTLSTNYAHYSRCADGLTMFAGNFDEYSAAFQIDVTTGSEADALFTRLMHDNAGWSGTSNQPSNAKLELDR
jgi:hypothetical protein